MSGVFIAYAAIIFLASVIGHKRAAKLSDSEYFGWLFGCGLQLGMAIIPAILL